MQKNFYFFTFITIAILHFSLSVQAQQGNNWCFGWHGGLDFRTDPPTQFQSAAGSTYYTPFYNRSPAHGASTISDCNGDLLFYATLTGIFNRFHQPMLNSSRVWLQEKEKRKVFIVPIPQDSFRYYLLYPVGVSNALHYSVIDMRLNNGLGDIDTTKLNIKLTNYLATSFIAVIPHANKKDSWVVAMSRQDSIDFFPLTNNGISTTSIRHYFNNNIANYTDLKANNAGNKIIISGLQNSIKNKSSIAMFDFDNATAQISNQKMFYDSLNQKISTTISDRHAGVVEFSPNDSFLYVVINRYYKWNSQFLLFSPYIIQYNINSQNIDSSGKIIITQVVKPPFVTISSLQLAPNYKIYFGRAYDSSLGVINFPNKEGKTCNAVLDGLKLNNALAGYSLPSIYSPIKNLYFETKSLCRDTTLFTNYSDTSFFKKFVWHFGDGDSATGYHAKHSYKKPGKYLVTLSGYNICNTPSKYTDSIEVTFAAHAYFKKDTLTYSCGKAFLSLNSTGKYSPYQQYIYDFGDSSGTDTSRNPTHIYTKAGTYKVTQTTYNGSCTDTITKNIQVNIEAFPEAAFTIPVKKACIPFTFQPKNNSKNSYTYSWDFGTGKTDTSFAPIVTINDTGWHKISHIAMNRQGCKDTLIIDSAIYLGLPPQPSFTYNQGKVCRGISINTSNNSQRATNHKWLFGDGAEDTAQSATHIYSKSGKYLLQLVAFNAYCSDTFTEELNIIVPDSTKADFTVSDEKGCPGLAVSFTNKSYNAVSYQWDFGDGNTDTLATPIHIYPDSGLYIPSLITTNAEGCKDTFVYDSGIEIIPVPEAKFAIKDSIIKCVAIEYTFSNNASFADSLRWDFGDGTKAVTTGGVIPEVKHIFTQSGNFKIKLTAFTPYCEDTISTNVSINLRPAPVASFIADSASVCFGKTVTFTNTSSEADSYLWDFGDGNIDTSFAPSHLYQLPGKYSVTLFAFSKEGCTDTLIKAGYIHIADLFQAKITASPLSGCAPLKVEFKAADFASSLPLNYSWDFGDGNTSTAQNTTHIYTGKGINNYQVKLSVSNGLCMDTISTFITITNFDDTKDAINMRLATVEDNKHILILWDKHKLASEYVLQRSVDGINYNEIAIIKDTFYRDFSVNVNAASFWYKVIGKDACGGESGEGKPARTILLNASSIKDDEKSILQWNATEGLQGGVAEYNILRDNQDYGKTPDYIHTFTDEKFFNTDSAIRCYAIIATENNSSMQSRSNEVCLYIKPKVWIPNAFTPNTDDLNKIFEVKNAGLISFHLVIYDRWGAKVFESNDTKTAWDGKLRGEKAPEGVYLLTCKAQAANGEWIFRKGTLQLLR